MEREFKQQRKAKVRLNDFVSDSDKQQKVVDEAIRTELASRSQSLSEMSYEQKRQLGELFDKIVKDTLTDLDNYRPGEFELLIEHRSLIHRKTGAVFMLAVRSLDSWSWYSTSHPQKKWLRSPSAIWNVVQQIEINNRPEITNNISDKLIEREQQRFLIHQDHIKHQARQAVNSNSEMLRSIKADSLQSAKTTLLLVPLMEDRGDYIEHLPTRAKIKILPIGSCCWHVQHDSLGVSRVFTSIEDLKRELSNITLKI